MIGERNSFKSNVLLNPLVWIGVLLAVLHLRCKSGNEIWEVFTAPTTYYNLLIGALIWTAIFDRHYTQNREKIDIPATLTCVLLNAYTILATWGIIVFVITEYHAGGLQYSRSIKQHIEANIGQKTSPTAPAPQLNIPLNAIDIPSARKYKVTPSADGSFIIEVLE